MPELKTTAGYMITGLLAVVAFMAGSMLWVAAAGIIDRVTIMLGLGSFGPALVLVSPVAGLILSGWIVTRRA